MKTIEERYGCVGCTLASCEGCDSFLLVKGATEQEAIDIDHLREVKKMLIDKACDAHCRICDYYLCCPYEFELEGCYERNEILKAMEE